jgi:Protein of unknown function (DUF4232)
VVAAIVAFALVGASAAAPPQVIPWRDVRPAKAPAYPRLAPPCRAGAVRAQLELQGASGSLVGPVRLTNIGSKRCSLVGRPFVSFVGPAAAATRWRVRRLPTSPAPPDVLADPPGSLRAFAPGKVAALSLEWSNWCGPGSQPTGRSGTPPTGLRLRLPGGASLVMPLQAAPRCDVPHDPSLLLVGTFAPAERVPQPGSRLPLRAEIAGNRPARVKPGLFAFRVARGGTLRYVVGLTNTGRRVFRFGASCPVYVEQLVPSVPQRAYVLNCRPAPPLAPGRTLRFEMRLQVPDDARLGENGLSWELAPRTSVPPFATAAVHTVR